jgi:thiol:disulfide interchange protein
MKQALAVIVIVIILATGVYFLVSRKAPPTSTPTTSQTSTSDSQPSRTGEEYQAENYRAYTKEEYEASLSEGKIVMLYFTANWCPVCREQEPINKETLMEFSNDPDIVAFRVHILDSEETSETTALADKYDVRYQHTWVIIGKGGKVDSVVTGPISKADLKTSIIAAKS